MQVCTFGVLMTSPVVLETAADQQLFDLTGESVSDVVVFTGALLLPLFTEKRRHHGSDVSEPEEE